jgi:hypothetical protein
LLRESSPATVPSNARMSAATLPQTVAKGVAVGGRDRQGSPRRSDATTSAVRLPRLFTADQAVTG